MPPSKLVLKNGKTQKPDVGKSIKETQSFEVSGFVQDDFMKSFQFSFDDHDSEDESAAEVKTKESSGTVEHSVEPNKKEDKMDMGTEEEEEDRVEIIQDVVESLVEPLKKSKRNSPKSKKERAYLKEEKIRNDLVSKLKESERVENELRTRLGSCDDPSESKRLQRALRRAQADTNRDKRELERFGSMKIKGPMNSDEEEAGADDVTKTGYAPGQEILSGSESDRYEEDFIDDKEEDDESVEEEEETEEEDYYKNKDSKEKGTETDFTETEEDEEVKAFLEKQKQEETEEEEEPNESTDEDEVVMVEPPKKKRTSRAKTEELPPKKRGREKSLSTGKKEFVLDSFFSKSEKGKSSSSSKEIEETSKKLDKECIKNLEQKEGLNKEEVKKRIEERLKERALLKPSDEASVLCGPKLWSLLKPFQTESVSKMLDRHRSSSLRGLILADDMGLGKTVQASVLIESIFSTISMYTRVCLVVSPLSLLHSWRAELKRWSPSSDMVFVIESTQESNNNNIKRFIDIHMEHNEALRKDPQNYKSNMIKRPLNIVVVINYDSIGNKMKFFRDWGFTFEGGNEKVDLSGLGPTDVKELADKRDPDTWVDSVFQCAILDEGHLLKGEEAQKRSAIDDLNPRSKIILTGTPLPNNPEEMKSLYDCVFSRETIFGSAERFRKMYGNKIKKGNHSNVAKRVVQEALTTVMNFRKLTSPFFIRRTKAECLDVKIEKLDLTIWIPLSSAQQKAYLEFMERDDFKARLDRPSAKRGPRKREDLMSGEPEQSNKYDNEEGNEGDNSSSTTKPISTMTAFTRLSQICSHPYIATAREEIIDEEKRGPKKRKRAAKKYKIAEIPDCETIVNNGCKFPILIKLVNNLIADGHKILIFHDSERFQELIKTVLNKNDIQHFNLDGNTKSQDRLKNANYFNDPENTDPKVFVLNMKAGSVGLTLTGATRVIMLETSWTPANENQAADRAFRIGQTKNVVVYRFITCSTIEEKKYSRQIFKSGYSSSILEDKIVAHFREDEIKELMSRPEDFNESPTFDKLQKKCMGVITSEFCKKEIDRVEMLLGKSIVGITNNSILFNKNVKTDTFAEIDKNEASTVRPEDKQKFLEFNYLSDDEPSKHAPASSSTEKPAPAKRKSAALGDVSKTWSNSVEEIEDYDDDDDNGQAEDPSVVTTTESLKRQGRPANGTTFSTQEPTYYVSSSEDEDEENNRATTDNDEGDEGDVEEEEDVEGKAPSSGSSPRRRKRIPPKFNPDLQEHMKTKFPHFFENIKKGGKSQSGDPKSIPSIQSKKGKTTKQ